MIEYREEMWQTEQKPGQKQDHRKQQGSLYPRPYTGDNSPSGLEPNNRHSYLDSHRPFSLKQSLLRTSKPGKEDFYSFLQKMKNDMNAGLEREDDSYFELNGKALIGDPQAVSFL